MKHHNQGGELIRKCHIWANTISSPGYYENSCLRQTSSYAGTQYPLDHAMPQRIKRAPVLLLGRTLTWRAASSLEALFCRCLNTDRCTLNTSGKSICNSYSIP